MHFLISILPDVILLQRMLSFLRTEPLGSETHSEHAISWWKPPPCLSNSGLSIILSLLFTAMPPAFPLYSCRANAMHFIFAFSPSVYWPRFLSTRHPSLSVSYEVHLKCHLLFEVFASFQDSKWFWVYSRPQSTCPSLRASPGASLILPFLSFPTRFGAPGGQELILGIFFFSWLLRFLCARAVQQIHWIPIFGRIWSCGVFRASILHHPTELFQPPNLTALIPHPLLWQWWTKSSYLSYFLPGAKGLILKYHYFPDS